MSAEEKFQSEQLSQYMSVLQGHPLYDRLNSLSAVHVFMKYHSFAVWDFMSLVKSLQRKLTSCSHPWMPSKYPGHVVRMINEVVLDEESDIGPDGQAASHFQVYLESMKEVGADTSPICSFLESRDLQSLPETVKDFVSYNLSVASEASVEEVAGVFFWGREKIIPKMFTGILQTLDKSEVSCEILKWYLDRHIQLDGEEHQVHAAQICEVLVGDDNSRWQKMESAALKALKMRKSLWDQALKEIDSLN